MDDATCPRCKTSKYQNPSLKLMVNTCGHGLCENCVNLLFANGSGTCHQCNIPLRRNKFRLQIFEDSSVEKEIDIRRSILKDYNKKEDDFPNLRAYNDYLEEIESTIFNLVNNLNVESTKRKIEEYKKENKTQILKNKCKLSKEEQEIEDMLEEERQDFELRQQHYLEEEKAKRKECVNNKESLLDELMFSDLPARDIVASCASNSKKQKVETDFKPPPPKRSTTTFSTGMKLQNPKQFLPVPRGTEGVKYVYNQPVIDLCGPNAPDYNSLEDEGFLMHVRAASITDKASGFLSNFACYRALQEAFSGLYFTPRS